MKCGDLFHPFTIRENPFRGDIEEYCPACRFTKTEIMKMATNKEIPLWDKYAMNAPEFHHFKTPETLSEYLEEKAKRAAMYADFMMKERSKRFQK